MLAERQFAGRFGAILTFRAGSRERAFRFLDRVQVALLASNIGEWLRTSGITPAIPVGPEPHNEDEMMMHPEERRKQ